MAIGSTLHDLESTKSLAKIVVVVLGIFAAIAWYTGHDTAAFILAALAVGQIAYIFIVKWPK